MKLTPQSYKPMVEAASPPSNLKRDCLWAFGVGGGICLLGEVLRQTWLRMGFTLTDSKANFLFAESSRIPGGVLYRKLKEKGILVRHFDKPRLENRLRITVGSEQQMEALLTALKELGA